MAEDLPAPEGAGHTHHTRFRIPRVMWDAYGRVTARLDTTRTARLLDHIRADIREHGDEQDLKDLAEAEAELSERRSRKGGRPPTRK
ncbi:hypothetical protein GCM10010517_36380 [Streptosporangium fragile]|uniref:Uncharacterized protein n=1 Tax=Streptosporangium fragile TaxID=46186 RepID=A0ABN3W0X0_9ACTN